MSEKLQNVVKETANSLTGKLTEDKNTTDVASPSEPVSSPKTTTFNSADFMQPARDVIEHHLN